MRMQVAWIGQWGSKIEALMRRLLWLRQHHPEIKSLVRQRSDLLLNCRAIPITSLDLWEWSHCNDSTALHQTYPHDPDCTGVTGQDRTVQMQKFKPF